MASVKRTWFSIDLAVGAQILGWLGILFAVTHITNTKTQFYPGINIYGVSADLIGGFIQIIVCACLIGGAKTKTKALLLPWIVLSMIGLISINVKICIHIGQLSITEVLVVLLGLLFVDLICGCFWLNVLSLYCELNKNGRVTAIAYNEFHSTKLIPSRLDKDDGVV